MQNQLKTLDLEEITPQAALIFVDNALYRAEGRRLNDLESRIFLGSWEGKTYEEIHPLNPEYVEKTVGYKLWKKLSIALGEKVSKKRIRGAVMRHYCGAATNPASAPAQAQKTKYAIIWHQPALNDPLLVQTLRDGLEHLGYQVQASSSEPRLGEARSSSSGGPSWAGDALVITVSTAGVAPNAALPSGD